jgi:starch synthase
MHIIHFAAEIAPVAKVGGLGDVILGMNHEFVSQGQQVDIVLPKYRSLDIAGIQDLKILHTGLKSRFNGGIYDNTIWTGTVRGLNCYFIEPHHPKRWFDRDQIYGYSDDLDRFLYFSSTALEFLKAYKMAPDIIHLHEWQTSCVAPLYYDLYAKKGYNKPKIVLTIHNFEHQGICSPRDLNKIGLTGELYLTPDKLQDNLHPTAINLLKGGIVYADALTTVSPRYANEVLNPSGGRGLESTLLKHKNKFSGILNGLDYSYWNPALDPFLPEAYSPDHLQGKAKSREKLRAFANLGAEHHRPIIGCIARLVPQKGIDLIKHAINYTLSQGGQFVLLGSSPIPEIQEEFEKIKRRLADNRNVFLNLHHDEERAHVIYAGCDIFVVPSLFEPCGLTQLISLKYGTIPIVRHTGGLADTIYDVDDSGLPFEQTNGYSFQYPDNQGVEYAMNRALRCFKEDPEKWRRLVLQGMRMDYSWAKPAQLYLGVYRGVAG